MADNKLPDGEIQEQRRERLCKLTEFVGAAGAAAAVWSLVSALGPGEETLGENEPIDVSLAGVVAGRTVRRIWQGRLILIYYRTSDEIIIARSADLDTLIDPQLDSTRVSAARPQWLVVQGYHLYAGCVPNARPGGVGWICPCHDSEFDTFGCVMHGPVTANLAIPDYVIHSDGQVARIGTKKV